MFTARVRNDAGEELTLTGRETEYQIIRITGLNPPEAQINLVPLVAMDGARYNSARIETRELVLTIRVNGSVETNRIRLYNYFRTKRAVTFFYANGTLDVSIDGYVQTVETDLFSKGEIVQVTILCPFPYFAALDAVIADSTRALAEFEFPFSINTDAPVFISSLDAGGGAILLTNSTDTECGFILDADLKQDCGEIVVKNLTSGGALTLRGSFLAGDDVRVSTVRGQKSILIIRGGEILNGFSTLTDGSVFWQVVPGENVVEYMIDGTATSPAAVLTFTYKQLYRGV